MEWPKPVSACSRRTFLARFSSLLGVLPFGFVPLGGEASGRASSPELHIFSKHLQFLPYEEMAARAAELGFDGVELTVREGGHVAPERVKEDLPRAVSAIRQNDLKATLIVTDITRADDRSRAVLETAAASGIQFYRLGYYEYPDTGTLPEALRSIRKELETLGSWNRELGLQGTFQNHAGGLVGAAMWEIWQLIKGIDPRIMGVQYDIRHAKVDGGQSWENGLRLVKDRILTLALKDFLWVREEEGWDVLNVPVGEGMVEFTRFFRLLKDYGITVPMSMHYEYDLFGAEYGSREVSPDDQRQVFAAMKRDLSTIRTYWKEA